MTVSRAAIAGVSCWMALGCSSGGGGGPPQDSGVPPAIALSADAATVSVGGKQLFTADVTGASPASVNWSVQEAGGGTIAPDGVYWAPADAGTFHVSAVSAALPSLTATATVTVTTAQAVSVVVSPAELELNPGGTAGFGSAVFGTTDAGVTWSLKEGSSGGSVTSAGAYTAPSTAGTFHVVATSTVDPTRTAQARVIVQTGAAVSVSLSPAFVELGSLETQAFAAAVSGGDGGVTWTLLEGPFGGQVDGNGQYTAPVSPGIFHVLATSQADPTQFATATVLVDALADKPTVTGSLGYAGTHTGRVYVGLFYSGCTTCQPVAGTSLSAPGPFSIRAASLSGSFTVGAYMDTLDDQQLAGSADPAVTSLLPLTLTGAGAVDAGALTLVDPTPTAPGDGGVPSGFFSADAVVLGWQPPTEPIDHLRVYAAPKAQAPCPTAVSAYPAPRTFVAPQGGGGPAVFFSGLIQGMSYCFVVTGLAGGAEGPPSAPWGPVAVAPPDAGHSVSGSVALDGLTLTGPLYVAVVAPGANGGVGQIYFTDFAAPANPQAFTVPGVADGTYALYGFLDEQNQGAFVPGLVGNLGALNPPQVKVSGADVTGAKLTLQAASALGAITTTHTLGRETDGGTGDLYGIALSLQGGSRLPLTVTLAGGPNLATALDLAPEVSGGSTSLWATSVNLAETVPHVGDTYQLQVTYTDGTMAPVNVVVTGVVNGVATLQTPAPGGTASSDTPTFTWTVPSGLPAMDVQTVFVTPVTGGNFIWQLPGLPTSQSSIGYNADGNASQSSLTSGGLYDWGILIADPNGNSSSATASFTAP